MTTPVIIDSIVVAALAGFAIYGACRGLFRALAGLAVFLAALVGAGLIASALAAPAARVVTPLIAEHISAQVEEAASAPAAWPPQLSSEKDETFEILDLLERMGLDEDVRTSLAQRAEERVHDAGASIATAVVESVAESLIYAALYILAFFLLTLLLRLAARALDLVFRLPGLNLLNGLGGAAIGLVEGALLAFLAIWVARRLGVSFETETVEATRVLAFFTTHTPLSALTFLL